MTSDFQSDLERLLGLLGPKKATTRRRSRAGDTAGAGVNYAARIAALEKENLDRALALLRGFYIDRQWDFRLYVNDAELRRKMDITVTPNVVYDRMIFAARQEFEPLAKKILLGIFKIATRGMPDGAFPREYKIALDGAISRMPDPKVTGHRPQDALVTLPNLYQYLGDYSEYEKGFHDQALLAKDQYGPHFDRQGKDRPAYSLHPFADRVVLPYGGQTLKEPRAGLRHKAWQALLRGEEGYWITSKQSSSYLTKEGKQVVTRSQNHKQFIQFPPGSSWSLTKKQRLKVWGAKAPFWLIIELGQPNYAPIAVPPSLSNLETLREIQITHVDKLKGRGFTGVDQFGLKSIKNTMTTTSVGHGKGGSRPANVSLAWIEACSTLWTTIITRVWQEQIAAFNSGETGVAHGSGGGGGPAGSASGSYNYQSGNVAAGVSSSGSYGSILKSQSQDIGWDKYTTPKYIEALKRNQTNFERALDRIMSDYDEFGG